MMMRMTTMSKNEAVYPCPHCKKKIKVVLAPTGALGVFKAEETT